MQHLSRRQPLFTASTLQSPAPRAPTGLQLTEYSGKFPRPTAVRRCWRIAGNITHSSNSKSKQGRTADATQDAAPQRCATVVRGQGAPHMYMLCKSDAMGQHEHDATSTGLQQPPTRHTLRLQGSPHHTFVVCQQPRRKPLYSTLRGLLYSAPIRQAAHI